MKNLLLFAAVTIATSSCFAGLLLEPHIGYESSAVAANYTSTPALNEGYKTSGLSLGARVGYHLPVMLWFAGDVDYSTGKNEWADTARYTTSYDFTRTDLYAVVGVDLPVLLRGWIGYGFSASNSLKNSTGSSSAKFTGTAMKFGLAFKGLPFINLTAEAIIRTMTKYESNGVSDTISSAYVNYKDAGVRLGVSIPLNL